MNSWYLQAVKQPDSAMKAQAQARQLTLTKPPGSLGQLEAIAVELAAMQNRINPQIDQIEIAVFAGDHGIMEEGVSAFPQSVTAEMVKNFVHGGAAISVLARQIDANLTVVNAGTVYEKSFDAPVVDKPVASGTKNFKKEDAMSSAQVNQCLDLGRLIVDSFNRVPQIVIGGEMGIGNTSSATALAAVITGVPVKELVGPGTGLDTNGIDHKQAVIEFALKRIRSEHQACPSTPQQTVALLSALGGFEIAALAGFYIAAAQSGCTLLIDGFIASSAAMVAIHINPGCRAWMIFTHASAEPGHAAMMHYLQAQPLIDLNLRLGEGSGAAIATSLIKHACALHNEMATFEQASVSNKA